MATYRATVMVNRPTFVEVEVVADDFAAARTRIEELVEGHLGPKYVEDFDEMIGMSQGEFDGFEIIDVEDVTA